ncbi:MAG: T9SS type A sorting domain-containing protein [Flavobacteriales bacterium]|nr:T9SS type A sorting domain-containing protein [Flavobacteriales bacterium]
MRTTLLCIPLVLLAGQAQGQEILAQENFDAHPVGSLIAQTIGAPWTTWSTTVGTNEEATISDEQAASGTNSGKWVSTAATGGPVDMVVQLGNRTTGTWSIGFKMYIPTGKGAYFNLLHDFAGANSLWATEISFLPEGDIRMLVQGAPAIVDSYTHDTWFDVHILVDLDADNAEFAINGNVLNNWTFSWDAQNTTDDLLQLGALNFYAYAGGTGTATYYIDDLLVAGVSGIGIAETNGLVKGLYPNPATDKIEVQLEPSNGPGQWVVRDLMGRSVIQGVLPNLNDRLVVEVSALRSGIYAFEVAQAGQRATARFMKR